MPNAASCKRPRAVIDTCMTPTPRRRRRMALMLVAAGVRLLPDSAELNQLLDLSISQAPAISSRQRRSLSTFVDATAAGAGTVVNSQDMKKPLLFVDDGMFDPRQDYWNSSSTTSGRGARGLVTTASSDCGTASSSNPCCIECFGLEYCDVLNRYKVEDKYYPSEATILGSCENFEDRASRLDVFGPAKTFRDTVACREMVYDYTCLWWGSDNEMYDNRCGIEAQVYPCRSYCVQLARTCANNMVEWVELCRAIDCPPTDEECVPGPYTQDIDEACYLYEYHSPLNGCIRTSSPGELTLATIVTLAVVAVAAQGFSITFRQ